MLQISCGMQNRNRFIFLSKLNILLWSTTQNHKAKLYNNIFICWKATFFSLTKHWFKGMMLEGFLLYVLCLPVNFNSTRKSKRLFTLHSEMKEKGVYFFHAHNLKWNFTVTWFLFQKHLLRAQINGLHRLTLCMLAQRWYGKIQLQAYSVEWHNQRIAF